MKSIDTARLVVLASAVGVLALGGCASAAKTSRPVAAASSTASTASSSTDPRQIALADAQRLIGSLARIPGAVRLSKPPAALADPAAPAVVDPSSPDLVVTGWYSLSVPYKQALADASAILDDGRPADGYGNVGKIQNVSFGTMHRYANVLGDQTVSVSAFGLTAETSALAITVTDGYRPAKTAAENFPTSGTLDVSFGSVTARVPRQRTLEVTDPQTIAGVAAILDALPTWPLLGSSSCPNHELTGKPSTQHEIDLTFRRAAGAASEVEAVVYQPLPDEPDINPCGLSGVSVKTGPPLDTTGQKVYAQVAALLGLPAGS